MMVLILKELPFPGNNFGNPEGVKLYKCANDQLVCFCFLGTGGLRNKLMPLKGCKI